MEVISYAKFFKMITEYYGDYPNEAKSKIVMSYIMKNVPEPRLVDLYNKLTRTYGSEYRSPPDIHAINTVLGRDGLEMARLDAIIDRFSRPLKQIGGSESAKQIEGSADNERS